MIHFRIAMAVEDQKIVGENFLEIQHYIRHKRGNVGLRSFQNQSSFNFDEILKGKFYPFEDYTSLLKHVKDMYKDESIAYKIGFHRAKTILITKGIKDHGYDILDDVTTVWHRFNNFGEVSVKKHEEGKYSVMFSGYESHPLYCERTRGFLTGLVSSGSEHCSVKEVSCVLDGKKACEFVIEKKE
jgi:hypothetical protein